MYISKYISPEKTYYLKDAERYHLKPNYSVAPRILWVFFFDEGGCVFFFRPPPVRFHKSLNSFLVVVCLSPSSQEYMYENLICPPSQPTSQDNPSSDTWLLYPKWLSAQLRKVRTVYFVRVGCVQIKSLKLPWVMLHHPLPASLIALTPLKRARWDAEWSKMEDIISLMEICKRPLGSPWSTRPLLKSSARVFSVDEALKGFNWTRVWKDKVWQALVTLAGTGSWVKPTLPASFHGLNFFNPKDYQYLSQLKYLSQVSLNSSISHKCLSIQVSINWSFSHKYLSSQVSLTSISQLQYSFTI